MAYPSQLRWAHTPGGGASGHTRQSNVSSTVAQAAGAQRADLVTTLCAGISAAALMSFRVIQSAADASYFA